ncbi:1507_t:CDS:2, partial [Gigaspora rosea]
NLEKTNSSDYWTICNRNDEINITINQYVPLNISSLSDEPSIYDLPIAPAFGVLTAPIQNPTVIENGQGIFRLKRDVYNGVTTNQSSLSILCKYPLHNRYANIKDATTRRPIFSVGGELITLAKSAFILCKTIEWNYPALSSNTLSYAETNTPSTSEQSSHPGPSSHIDKGKQPTTLEKDTKTPSITTNNNFILNHNTTTTPHEYSDRLDASE